MTRLARPFPAIRLAEFAVEHPRLEERDITYHYRTTFEKWKREDTHFTIYEADRRAVDLGFHASEIWGWDEWIAATLDDRATPSATVTT